MDDYERCWDLLHDRLCKASKTIHDPRVHVFWIQPRGGWAEFVLNWMTDIENEIIGPIEE